MCNFDASILVVPAHLSFYFMVFAVQRTSGQTRLPGFAHELASLRLTSAAMARARGDQVWRPSILKQDAFVRDAAHVIESMNLQGTIVIGQSMGGRTALLLCAHRPDLARALVFVEATPARDPSSVGNLRRQLAKWPTLFASREEAECFFAGPGLTAPTWAGSLEQHDAKH